MLIFANGLQEIELHIKHQLRIKNSFGKNLKIRVHILEKDYVHIKTY